MSQPTNGISIGSAVFATAGLTNATNRHRLTDHATPFVAPIAASYAMRPGNILQAIKMTLEHAIVRMQRDTGNLCTSK